MRTGLIIIAIGTLFGLAVYGIYSQFVQRTKQAPQFELPSPSPQPSPTPTSTPAASPPASTQRGELASPKPSPAPPTQPQTGISRIGDTGVIINSPQALSTVSSPLVVSGWTKIPDREFTVKVKDENGHVLASLIETTDCSSLQVCAFETTVTFNKPASPLGTVEVSSGDLRDQVVVQFN